MKNNFIISPPLKFRCNTRHFSDGDICIWIIYKKMTEELCPPVILTLNSELFVGERIKAAHTHKAHAHHINHNVFSEIEGIHYMLSFRSSIFALLSVPINLVGFIAVIIPHIKCGVNDNMIKFLKLDNNVNFYLIQEIIWYYLTVVRHLSRQSTRFHRKSSLN